MAADKVYKRILLKLSGEALTGQEAFGIDPKVLDQLALEIGQLVGIGVQVGLVVSPIYRTKISVRSCPAFASISAIGSPPAAWPASADRAAPYSPLTKA